MITDRRSSGYRSLSELRLTDGELRSPSIRRKISLDDNFDEERVRSSKQRSKRGIERKLDSDRATRTGRSLSQRQVRWFGGSDDEDRRSSGPERSTRAEERRGGHRWSTEANYGSDDGAVESDYEDEGSSGRTARKDDRRVAGTGRRSSDGRRHEQSYRDSKYGQRELNDDYDRHCSRTVQRSRAEERDHGHPRTIRRRPREEKRTVGHRNRGSKYDRSSSSYSDGQSGNTVTRSRKGYIRPEKFSGSGSFETFYAHFQNCAVYNRWTEKDQLAHLKACLTSDAGQVLWDSSPEATDTLQKLTDLLKNRFGAVRQQDKHRMELRIRRRRSQETLSALHQDVRRLMALAYPNLEHSSRETLACDYFIDALDDADFALKVRVRMPVTLDDALRYALQLEAWMKNADRVRGQNWSPSQEEPMHHKLKGRGATDSASKQPLDVGHLAEMIESSVERSINARLNAPKATVTEKLQNSRVQEDGPTTSAQPVITVTNPKWPARRNDRPSYACFQCGELGHLKKECPNRSTKAEKVKQEQPTSVNRGITGLGCHNVYLKFRMNGQTVPGLLDTGCENTFVVSVCSGC